MAHQVTCNECHEDLPAYEAVIRSIALERVAWHPECFTGQPRRRPLPQTSALQARLRQNVA